MDGWPISHGPGPNPGISDVESWAESRYLASPRSPNFPGSSHGMTSHGSSAADSGVKSRYRPSPATAVRARDAVSGLPGRDPDHPTQVVPGTDPGASALLSWRPAVPR